MRFAALAVGLVMIWPTSGLAARRSHASPPPAAVPAAPAQPVPPPPPPFEPKERDFTVGFPGAPRVGFKLVVDGKERSYLDNEGDRLFMVTASTFMFGAKTDDQAFDRRLNQFAVNMGATLASRERVNWCGNQGWEAVFTTPQGTRILVRLMVHDKRLYQAVYQGPGDNSATAQGYRFMDSFRLLDR
jgi:hypothetical protein